MMPRIGLHGGALELLAESPHHAEEDLLHDHYRHQHDQGESARPFVRQEKFPHTLDREHECRREHA